MHFVWNILGGIKRNHIAIVVVLFVFLCSFVSVAQQGGVGKIDTLLVESQQQFENRGKEAVVFDSILQKAFYLAQESNNQTLVAKIYQIIGKRYRTRSDYTKATEYFQRAVNIAEAIDNPKEKAYSKHEIAVVLRRINNNSRALKYHSEVLAQARELRDTFLIHISLNGIGNIYVAFKDYEKSIDVFRESLEHIGKGKSKNVLGEAINTNNIGEAYFFMGNLDSAEVYFEQSLTLNKQINSKFGQGICYNSLGNVYEGRGDYKKALEYYHRSLEYNKEIGDHIFIANNYMNIGTVHFKQKNYKVAEEYLQKGHDLASSIGATQEKLVSMKTLAELYAKQKRYEKSYSLSVESQALADSITNAVQRVNSEVLVSLNEAREQEKELQLLKKEAELSQLKLQREKTFLIIGIVLLLFVILVVGILYNQRRLQNRLGRLKLEQRLFRSQLNPHFIFNSLAAVQNFILGNDKMVAFDYLSDFAQLMRNILMGSRKDEIPLAQEVDILNTYIKLQQLRFQNIFDFTIEIGEELDIESTMLPPMLIQPFVENAIEHGLRPMKKGGSLKIKFGLQENKLTVSVDDNGVGFTKQEEEKGGGKHVSLATKITKERLFVIESITKEPCELSILNKKDVSDENGVKVVVSLPLKFNR
jgi:tetratricopeptide (TPR) repeat protein